MQEATRTRFEAGRTYFVNTRTTGLKTAFRVVAVHDDLNLATIEMQDGTVQRRPIQRHGIADGRVVDVLAFNEYNRLSWSDQPADEVFGEEWVAVFWDE
jgi:hypothetical protein